MMGGMIAGVVEVSMQCNIFLKSLRLLPKFFFKGTALSDQWDGSRAMVLTGRAEGDRAQIIKRRYQKKQSCSTKATSCVDLWEKKVCSGERRMEWKLCMRGMCA